MNISLRILLGYFAIVAVAAYFVLNLFVAEVKPGVRQAMEDTLHDTAQLLAKLAADDLARGHIADGAFARAVQDIGQSPLPKGARKAHIDYRVYLTDGMGTVVFDSDRQDVGKSYARWNDVYLTLHGQYGARSTRSVANDDSSSVMHVAAPVLNDGKLIGVLTVAKPNKVVQPFIDKSRQRIVQAGMVLLGVALLIGLAFSAWITGSVRRLVRFAEAVTRGERAQVPQLGAAELGALGRALQTMRERLEGKQHVEKYVQTLTHEMKSPLTAIAGAAELLHEDLPAAERQRFAGNVRAQAERLRQLVERLLGLAAVEARQQVDQPQQVELAEVVREAVRVREPVFLARGLQLDLQLDPVHVKGDKFLLGQAAGNLLDNAAAFSPPDGKIAVALAAADGMAVVTVRDQGQGVPDYALPQVFERFYSLPSVATGQKSTGLGLPFVREVAALHGGSAELANHPDGGAVATVRVMVG